MSKVPRSMRRQVPTIWEMQKDQKPEEVQINFKVYVDHAKDGQNDTMSCMKGAPHLVFTSKAGRTKPKCRKTRTSVHAMNSRERQPMKRCQKRWEARKRAVRPHQTCRPVDQCAHTSLSRGVPADHEARSPVKRRQLQETKGDAEASLKRKTRSRRIHNRGDAHVQERDKSHQHT